MFNWEMNCPSQLGLKNTDMQEPIYMGKSHMGIQLVCLKARSSQVACLLLHIKSMLWRAVECDA